MIQSWLIHSTLLVKLTLIHLLSSLNRPIEPTQLSIPRRVTSTPRNSLIGVIRPSIHESSLHGRRCLSPRVGRKPDSGEPLDLVFRVHRSRAKSIGRSQPWPQACVYRVSSGPHRYRNLSLWNWCKSTNADRPLCRPRAIHVQLITKLRESSNRVLNARKKSYPSTGDFQSARGAPNGSIATPRRKLKQRLIQDNHRLKGRHGIGKSKTSSDS